MVAAATGNGTISDEDTWLINKVLVAERLGWTLEYIDSLDMDEYWRILAVLEGIDKARQRLAERASRQSGGQSTPGVRRRPVEF